MVYHKLQQTASLGLRVGCSSFHLALGERIVFSTGTFLQMLILPAFCYFATEYVRFSWPKLFEEGCACGSGDNVSKQGPTICHLDVSW